MVNIDSLRDSVLFSGCAEQDLKRLGEIAQTREYEDRQLLFALGEEATELMVISSGAVQLELPVSVLGHVRNIAFETKGRGDVVGWSALVPPNESTLNGRAVGKTTVVAFAKEELNAAFDADSGFGCRILKNLLSIVRLRLERTHTMWVHEIQESVEERYR